MHTFIIAHFCPFIILFSPQVSSVVQVENSKPVKFSSDVFLTAEKFEIV